VDPQALLAKWSSDYDRLEGAMFDLNLHYEATLEGVRRLFAKVKTDRAELVRLRAAMMPPEERGKILCHKGTVLVHTDVGPMVGYTHGGVHAGR